MQLMTWTVARLGGRFSVLFEPYRRRVLHSALGRFLDQPMDLVVGLVEPDGTLRTLPFTVHGQPLVNAEQFERLNSITYRAYSEKYRLRFEFNIHSVFYPQHERLCLLPAYYMEMRVGSVRQVRWSKPVGATPDKVKLVLRLDRPDTRITASVDAGGAIDLSYRNTLVPRIDADSPPPDGSTVAVRERIVSLNPGCAVDETGRGLTLELPVTEMDSGIKWRLIWAAHCDEPVLGIQCPRGSPARPARFRYTRYWPDLEAVVSEAQRQRDDYLSHSRMMEKIVEQAPLDQAQRHLIHQSLSAALSNTFWCDAQSPSVPSGGAGDAADHDAGWFSVWDGGCFFHSPIDVEYNVCLLYLTLWPRLLETQLDQWPLFAKEHVASNGLILPRDLGWGCEVKGQSYSQDLPVEANADYLLMLQAHAHFTGDLTAAQRHAQTIVRLADYLAWTDRDGSGFASEGVANTLDDALPAVRAARKQTYLAVKRLAALRAAADLLERIGHSDAARRYEKIVDEAVERVESAAWLGDHYIVCVDKPVADAWTGQRTSQQEVTEAEGYSIYTANGLLLPAMIGQPPLLDPARVVTDLLSAIRETKSPYGCGHTSAEPENVRISQNIWRDHVIRYVGLVGPGSTSRYWDMQVMSNTHAQSLGFVDTYVTNNLCFHPRGITSIGYLLARPRLVVDRLAAGGPRISVEPDRHWAQRWPLLPLADWKAGRVPVCVVDEQGDVSIEGECDPVIVRGQSSTAATGLIG